MELTHGSSEHRVDGPRIERAVREILVAIGGRPGTGRASGQRRTRVAEAYAFLFAGLSDDPPPDIWTWASRKNIARCFYLFVHSYEIYPCAIISTPD